MSDKTRYGIFKVIATCTSCGNPVVVNGPLTSPRCPSCRQALEIPPETWRGIVGDYVNDYEEIDPGEGHECTMMSGGLTVKYSYVRLPPPDAACTKCEENWDLKAVANGTDGHITCGKCGYKSPVYPAPDWLKQEVPEARQVFFAERDSDEDDAVVPGNAKPVALACPQCGGGLLITAETDRIAPCKYCGVDVYMPDGIWNKLHPAKIAKYWMVRFEGPFRKSGED
jgi:predicted RNA-binding Zn-ribbon protein involved in translation (DUF1610 family)